MNPMNPHMEKSKADSRNYYCNRWHFKSILPFLPTDYTLLHNKHDNSHKQTLYGPFSSEPLIETSGDNFLEEQSDWRWTGMPITFDSESGLCWHESWPVVTFRVFYRPSVVLSHIVLPLMSIGAFSHAPASRDLSGPWGEEGLRGYLRRGHATPEVTHHTAIPSSFKTPLKIIYPH